MTSTRVEYIRYAVDGNAARKIQAAPAPFKKISLPKIYSRKKKHICICIDPVAIFGICIAVCMFIMMGVGLNRYSEQQEKVAQMQAYVNELRAENNALEQTYLQSYDGEHIEHTAQALGMVPKTRVESVSLDVPLPQMEQSVSLWKKIGTFLTSLFA